MLLRINFILLFSAIVNFSHAQNNTPKYSNEFLSIGVGARSLGMGNSSVATVGDVTSTYWNPAGLTEIPNNVQLSLMHSEYFAGIAKYDYGSIAAKIDDVSSFGVSLIRFGVDDIPNTLELIDSDGNIRYDRIKSFSVADYAFLFSYARKSNIEGLRYGANAKVIRRKAGDFASAWGFGIDVSAQYDKGKWHFGGIARDITSTFNAWKFNTSELEETFIMTGNEIPENSLELTLPKFILGVARDFEINEKFNILAEIDFDITTDKERNVLIKGDPFSIDPHMGMEVSYINMIYFRAGVGNFQQIPDLDETEISVQPSIGLGLKYKNFALDYALTKISHVDAFYSNVFSITYGINKN